MAKYPKTTGQLVTTRIKIDSALNGGRMLLDDQLKEMIDLLWPVGASTPEFFQENLDWWLELVAQYGIEVAPKDGRLLKVADYPKLFNDGIGYTYGWANSNPGPTTTYTGTDVDGNPITYVHPADLDVAGNALPVPEGTSPAYFRLPNTLARFKREAGEASFVNEWTDTDGNPHAILTEYKAEIGRGQLDAQRGISGSPGPILSGWSPTKPFWHKTEEWPYNIAVTKDINGYKANKGYFDTSTKVPLAQEIASINQTMQCLLRIS